MLKILYASALLIIANSSAIAGNMNIQSNGIQCYKTTQQYICNVTNNTVTVNIQPVSLYNGNYRRSDNELQALMLGNFFMAGRQQEQHNAFNNSNNHNNGRYNNNNGQQVDMQRLIGLLFNR